MNQSRTLLVVGAHAADFVWRAAGIIAVVTKHGGRASVVALTYGERGESGELWKEPNQTVENVKRIRHEEATRAAEILGATFQCFDLGDYPLQIDAQALELLTMLIRELSPDVSPPSSQQSCFCLSLISLNTADSFPLLLSISARFFHSSSRPWRPWPHKATCTSTRRRSQSTAPTMRAVFPGAPIFSTRKHSRGLLPR